MPETPQPIDVVLDELIARGGSDALLYATGQLWMTCGRLAPVATLTGEQTAAIFASAPAGDSRMTLGGHRFRMMADQGSIVVRHLPERAHAGDVQLVGDVLGRAAPSA